MTSKTIVIIGSGFSGLCAAIQLKRRGIHDFVILEKAADIGGTWRDNTYPGAACDIRAMFYSFSFFINKDWSREYPQQPEIHAYLRSCAKAFKLYPHIQLNTEVEEMRYSGEMKSWLIQCKNGEQYEARFVLSGTGQLHIPSIPKFKGAKSFAGKSFHTAQWDHTLSLYKKKVAIIGNGASAIQVVPAIIDKVSKLTVIQRSANWIIPRWDRAYSLLEKMAFRFVPFVPELTRFGIWARKELLLPALNSSTNSPIRVFFETLVKLYINSQVKNQKLRKLITPDYPVGCKRVLISDDYLSALDQEHAAVVQQPIKQIVKEGLEMADGTTISADILIYATGFRTNDFLYPIQVFGKEGVHINDTWQYGAEAYLGISVPGFPNFFMLYGPNTNLGHNSIVFMIENQVNYILNLIEHSLQNNHKTIEVSNSAMADWSEECQHALGQSVWVQGCDSWYKNESGKVVNNWPYSTVEYWLRTMQVNYDHFLFDKEQRLHSDESPIQVTQ